MATMGAPGGQLLPPAVVTLRQPKRLFDCAADCPKSHGYVHTLFGDSAPWLLPLPTETPLPCGHPVCVECIAARPALLAECGRCNTRRSPDRPAKRARLQQAPGSRQGSRSSSPPPPPPPPSASSSSSAAASASPGADSGGSLGGAVPFGQTATGLSSVAEAFFQRGPVPSTSTDGGEYAYEVGEACLVPDDTYVPGSYFEVRVMERRRGGAGYSTEYRVHFLGWKSRYDKWLGAPALVPLTRIVGEGAPSGAALIGRRVGCWWRDDKRWFCGHIVAYREPGNGPVSVGGGGAFGAARIRYDDGEALWEPLPPPTRTLQEMTMRLQPSAAEHAMIRLGRKRAIDPSGAEPLPDRVHGAVGSGEKQGGPVGKRLTRARSKAEGGGGDAGDHKNGPPSEREEEHVIASEDEDDDDSEEEWLTTGSRWLGPSRTTRLAATLLMSSLALFARSDIRSHSLLRSC